VSDIPTEQDWVYVVVIKGRDEDESLLGQEDKEAGVSYIPFFKEKEAAEAAMANLVVERGYRREVQAMPLDMLKEQAQTNGFFLFFLDESGRMIDKIAP
jgi:hypothetical protein